MIATKANAGARARSFIPAPMEVDELMRRVPQGKLVTIDELRKVSRGGMARPSPALSPPEFLPGSPRTPPSKPPMQA